jgi:two-component system cell cycle response regulator
MTAPKILSVDDSKMIHTLIGKGFSAFNTELFFASNGVEGLAAATREMPDVIILDVTMPVMDGVECLAKLKSDPALKDIPVIMLTAEAGKENVLKIAKMGVRDYVVKPFTEQALVERVSRVIDLQPKGAAPLRIKSVDDPATILVVDEHPLIIETIEKTFAGSTWKVLGTDQCGEAAQLIAKEPPDVVLVSLSLPNKAALNFFHLLRSNLRTQSTPVVGLSVKTAVEEQAEAKGAGFSSIITKPIDISELGERLARAMNRDTSSRYFSVESGVQIVKIPNGITPSGSSELTQYINPKVREMVDAGLNRLIVDVSEIAKVEILIVKLLLTIIGACRELDIRFRVVGSAEFLHQARAFEETKDLEIFQDRAAALAAF